MRGEEKANFLSVLDKKVLASIKAAAWDEVLGQVDELRQALAESEPSRAERNWNPAAAPQALSVLQPEKKLGWAVAEGYGDGGLWADLPTASGLLGDKHARSLDLVRLDGEGLTFFACKVNPSGEDILKALRDLIVHTTLYRAFLEDPRKFGYNTGKSPLLLEEAGLRWELVAPKDMINPRKSEMRWGERDTQAMQRLMRSLGVGSFSLGRLQAEAEALQANIRKDHFSGGRARQWFEHRVTVLIA